jgi:hypothetical protein
MELREALSQIGEIRASLAREEVVCPTRSLTVGVVGLLACLGAAAQAVWIPQPLGQIESFLWLWIAVAAISAGLVAVELTVRRRAGQSAIARQATMQTIEQFMPCLVAGSCLTCAIVRFAPASAALLPGLWAITYGLGLFAAVRQLPAMAVGVAAYYMVAGTAAIAWAQDARALSPWTMVATFGAGHFLLAAAFYFGLERRHGTN